MSFSPYLHFLGNCAEAMGFYAEVFGATDLQMTRYADAPPSTGMPASLSDKIMHALLTVDGQPLMASDWPDGMPGEPQASVSVTHRVANVKRGGAIFARLAEGGAVTMPYAPTFWSEGFGMVKDRFGTHWMIMGPEIGDEVKTKPKAKAKTPRKAAVKV